MTWLDAQADVAKVEGDAFSIMAGGERFEGRRLVLATGVSDTLPDVPGLAERWGKAVFHCPYCHGYELNEGRIAVLGVSPLSIHHALMLPDWGSTTFLLNGAFEPDADQLAQMKARGVTLERGSVSRLVGERADVEMVDGRVLSFDGMFTLTRTGMASPLAEQLGCAFEEGLIGPFIQTNMMKQTSVPGVFACGDAARAMGSVAFAVGDGAMAGSGTHQSLMLPVH